MALDLNSERIIIARMALERVKITRIVRWLALLMLLQSSAVQAQFEYITNSDEITITKYVGFDSKITIPFTIEGLRVVSIKDNAFAFCSNLTQVTILNGFHSIGWNAFYYCTNLTSVTIPSGTIGHDAFSCCTSLTNVTIGTHVTSIGGNAFNDCPNLTTITVDWANNALSSVDGVLFNKIKTTLIFFPQGKDGPYAIPSSVSKIESYAFMNCKKLTSIIIPDSVTKIDMYTFLACRSLGNVIIPNSVTSIELGAFATCSSLTNISIPNSITNISNSAFDSCTSLTNVTIPSSVTSIGEGVFASCSSLTAIEVDALNNAYISIYGVLYNKSQTTLFQYPAGKSGNYSVSNSVNRIGASAFAACTSLTNVIIPNGVSFIGNSAFGYCRNLISVTIPNSITNIGYEAFAYCDCLKNIYFQGNASDIICNISAFRSDNSATIYCLPGTTGWGTVYCFRPVVLWNPQPQTTHPNFGIRTNQFGFPITASTNLTIVVEACTNLTNPEWLAVETIALTNGSAYFSDPQWAIHRGRFYRIRSP